MAREVIVPLVPALDFHQIKWTIPKRGDKKKLLDLSERNATSYKKDRALLRESAARRDSQPSLLTLLQKDLKLRRPPERIECFDNSNIQGQHPVASCVVFKSGRPLKSEYRHYNIKTVEGPDDFASMSEVVFRRYKRLMDEGIDLPELIIIDGGKGQLNAAVKSLEQLNIRKKVELIGIAKRLEEIYVPGDPVPLYLDKNSQSLRLIQRIRDEAHRFGITFHRNKRSKDFLKSALDTISGIGEKTREKILKQYRNLEDLKILEIQELEGIAGKKAAKILYSYFHANDTQV
jgi:excinuclease ABC subunit C